MANKKTLIISIVSVVVVAVACTVAVVVLRSTDVPHLQTQGVELSLVRDKLIFNELQENGLLLPKTDTEKKDFSKPTSENVFGITKNTAVIPGSMYAVEMTVTSQNDQPFVYWLEVKTQNKNSPVYGVLVFTVTTQDGSTQKFTLDSSFLIGNEQKPIATVTSGKSSTFQVKMEFPDGFSDNSVQGEYISFDLIVHAVSVSD